MVDSLNNNGQAAINSAQIHGQNSGVNSDQNKVENSKAIAARLQNDAVKTSFDTSVARDITDKITLSPKAEEIVRSSSEISIVNSAANQNNNIANNSEAIDEITVNEISPINDTNQVKRDDNRTGVINGNQDDKPEPLRSLGKVVDQFA